MCDKMVTRVTLTPTLIRCRQKRCNKMVLVSSRGGSQTTLLLFLFFKIKIKFYIFIFFIQSDTCCYIIGSGITLNKIFQKI